MKDKKWDHICVIIVALYLMTEMIVMWKVLCFLAAAFFWLFIVDIEVKEL